MEITYHWEGDYLIPDLKLSDTTEYQIQLRRLNIFCFEIIRNLKTLRRFGKEAGNFFFALRVKELLDGTKR